MPNKLLVKTPSGMYMRLVHYFRSPAKTRRWYNVGSLLGQRRRRWPNSEPALYQLLVFAMTAYISSDQVRLNIPDKKCTPRKLGQSSSLLGNYSEPHVLRRVYEWMVGGGGSSRENNCQSQNRSDHTVFQTVQCPGVAVVIMRVQVIMCAYYHVCTMFARDYVCTIMMIKKHCCSFNPSTAKLFNWNFHSLEVVSSWRDSQLTENYSELTK